MNIHDLSLIQTFTGQKLVKNRFLNRLGLQVARTYGARWLHNLRPTPVDPRIRDYLQQLRRDGMVVIENFFPNAEFAALKQECLNILSRESGKTSTKMHGPTEYSIALIKDFPDSEQEYIRKFYADPRLYSLMQAAEKN